MLFPPPKLTFLVYFKILIHQTKYLWCKCSTSMTCRVCSLRSVIHDLTHFVNWKQRRSVENVLTHEAVMGQNAHPLWKAFNVVWNKGRFCSFWLWKNVIWIRQTAVFTYCPKTTVVSTPLRFRVLSCFCHPPEQRLPDSAGHIVDLIDSVLTVPVSQTSRNHGSAPITKT